MTNYHCTVVGLKILHNAMIGNTTSFARCLCHIGSVAYVQNHRLPVTSPSSFMYKLVATCSSSIIWILGGMRNIFLSPFTTLWLSKRNHRPPCRRHRRSRRYYLCHWYLYGSSRLLNVIKKVSRRPTQFFLIVRLMLMSSLDWLLCVMTSSSLTQGCLAPSTMFWPLEIFLLLGMLFLLFYCPVIQTRRMWRISHLIKDPFGSSLLWPIPNIDCESWL